MRKLPPIRQHPPGPLNGNELAKLLRAAVEQGHLELHYQPQYVLATHLTVGLEAFVRWRSPVLGLLPAREFLGVAMASGDIIKIGQWALRSAAAQLAAWRAEGLSVARLAVNVSPVQVMQPDFVRSVSEAVYGFGLKPNELELEIAEPRRLRDAKEMQEKLTALHSEGVRLSLDGFGAARTSLGFLVRVPFSTIKISGSVVRGIERTGAAGQQSLTMLDLICTVGRRMNTPVAAGGVETELQKRALVKMGCSLAQGCVFARPQPAEEIGKLLRSTREASSPLKQTLSDAAIINGS